MTLEQFQATGRDVADLGAELRDDSLAGVGGRLYHGDLYIAKGAAGWWTLIGNSTHRSADLAEIEAKMHQFARDEGIA